MSSMNFVGKMSVLFLLCSVFITLLVNGAVVSDVDEQGLYSHSKDHVLVLTSQNFDRNVYGHRHAILLQFYNSYCGHCRAYAPKFKEAAKDLAYWSDFIQLAVLDCSIEENNRICRDFEVMSYPSVRYLHEGYLKSNGNLGDPINALESAEKIREAVVKKLQVEQTVGRMSMVPSLGIASYQNYLSAIQDISSDAKYIFLIFENENSTIGTNLILDMHDYAGVRIKRVQESSELAVNSVTHFPGLVVIERPHKPLPLTPQVPTIDKMRSVINSYLHTKNYQFPNREDLSYESLEDHPKHIHHINENDAIFYQDMEKALQTMFHTEFTRHKVLQGEPLTALIELLDILIKIFPFKEGTNLKSFIVAFEGVIRMQPSWKGEDIYRLLTRLESHHTPVFPAGLEYKGCKGSQEKYRGYTCGLWTLFHALTVSAAAKPGGEGARVLRGMHGYVKHFFGCTDCAQHFQDMAARNRLFEVEDNDKAVLWLWISHNEVNLRLAGDVTEDPEHPKVQFPSAEACPACRRDGPWQLPVVYQYLQQLYAEANIRQHAGSQAASGPLSNMDLGLLSLLYILSFVILILVTKLFLTKRFYRKKVYKHDGWGKVLV